MADRIVIAFVVAFIGLALLPPVNDMLYNNFLPLIVNMTDVTPFEASIWRFVPLVLIVFIGVAVIVALMRKEENKPPE